MIRFFLLAIFCAVAAAAEPEPLRVCCTTTDLGSLARHVGGDLVTVTVFANGDDDVHFLEAKPSFVKQLHNANLLVEVGMELESDWLPTVVDQSDNALVRTGSPGRLSAALANTAPLGRPTGPIDPKVGHVHAAGNPHYLSDPLIGWQVAILLRDRFITLRPEQTAVFNSNWKSFTTALAQRMVGPAVNEKLGSETVLLLIGNNTLNHRLEQEDLKDTALSGWLGSVKGLSGSQVIADHDLWPYFAQRFGISVIGFLEPQPGLPPTSKHLADIVELITAKQVKVIINAPYFDPKPGALVASRTGAKLVILPHQAGALAGTDDYLDCIDRCVVELVAGFAAH